MSCPVVLSYHVKTSKDMRFGCNHLIIFIGIAKLSSVSKYFFQIFSCLVCTYCGQIMSKLFLKLHEKTECGSDNFLIDGCYVT